MHRLTSSMSLPVDLSVVFAFFSDASNLERITPSELRFQIVTPRPIRMAKGTLIDYRLALFRVPFRWQSRITRWDPPHEFVDEQTRGPYKVWVHTHRFSEEDGTTRITDDVLYALPFWPVGAFAYPLVHGRLESIFAFRRRAIREAFGLDG